MPKRSTGSAHDLVTVGKIAKELGISQSAVRQALKDLKIKPKTIKSGCSYYDASVKEKIKKVVKP